MKYYIILITTCLCLSISCKKECNNTQNPHYGKIKSILIKSVMLPDTFFNVLLKYYYTTDLNRLDSISIITSRQDMLIGIKKDTASYVLRYYTNNILIYENKLNYSLPHRIYKSQSNNGILNRIYELDTLTNAEYPYLSCVFNTKLDTIYEPAVYPTALNRYCYDYVLEDGNYTQFKFDYDVATFLGGLYHVADTAFITYTSLPFNKYAPMQNMYSSSTLFNLGAPGEVIYDFNYILGFEDYYLYPHNQNLIQSIRTVHDSTTIVYFNYEFNSQNQLSKVKINFREPNAEFLEYNYEYY